MASDPHTIARLLTAAQRVDFLELPTSGSQGAFIVGLGLAKGINIDDPAWAKSASNSRQKKSRIGRSVRAAIMEMRGE